MSGRINRGAAIEVVGLEARGLMSAMLWKGSTGPAEIAGFNPQPDPPARVAGVLVDFDRAAGHAGPRA
jgi:hypothetical protein